MAHTILPVPERIQTQVLQRASSPIFPPSLDQSRLERVGRTHALQAVHIDVDLLASGLKQGCGVAQNEISRSDAGRPGRPRGDQRVPERAQCTTPKRSTADCRARLIPPRSTGALLCPPHLILLQVSRVLPPATFTVLIYLLLLETRVVYHDEYLW